MCKSFYLKVNELLSIAELTKNLTISKVTILLNVVTLQVPQLITLVFDALVLPVFLHELSIIFYICVRNFAGLVV